MKFLGEGALSIEAVFGLRMSLPAVLFVFCLLVVPLGFSLYVSLHHWNLTVIPNVLSWIGFDNYERILTEPETWKTLNFTFVYTIASVLGEVVCGLGLALLLDKIRVGRNFFMGILILPMMMAPIVTGLSWRLLLNADYGPLNVILGTRGTLWLGDPVLAQISVIAATIWQETPFMLIFFVARLRSLPIEPFEAAKIDGASAWQRFRYITLPMMMPVILVASLIRFIFEFRAFDIIWILTTGGPAGATETISLRNFEMTFRHFSIGPGAALSWFMLVVTSMLVIVYFLVIKRMSRNDD